MVVVSSYLVNLQCTKYYVIFYVRHFMIVYVIVLILNGKSYVYFEQFVYCVLILILCPHISLIQFGNIFLCVLNFMVSSMEVCPIWKQNRNLHVGNISLYVARPLILSELNWNQWPLNTWVVCVILQRILTGYAFLLQLL